LPPAIYLLAAMGSNMQYGVRHVLPVYPFIFLGIGLAAAQVWLQKRRVAGVLFAVLALGVICETARAFPNYIPFFNTAAGGSRGGIRLLGCSNIDWGQDLKLIADWQRSNPDKNLYLVYYGVAEPAYYGIKFSTMPAELPTGDNVVIAVSATYLQGLYLRPHINQAIEPLRHVEPTEILGGSIYLFDLSK
jgi:hypothetical protein